MAIQEMNQDTIYDILIIGGGPAAMNAALYALRKGRNVAIICMDFGGHVKDTVNIENYIGFMKIDGYELVQKFQDQVCQFDVPVSQYVEVTKIEDSGDVKRAHTSDGKCYKGKTMILATGSRHRHLNVKGEAEHFGMGLSYCAICDGPLFRNREVIIAGGGNSAVGSAIDLSKICKKITIIHRSQFRADSILQERMKKCENIEYYLDHQITEIFGEDAVEGVMAVDKKNNITKTFNSDAVFIEIGLIPNSDYAKGVVDINNFGEFVINDKCETSAEGIYAAGDVSTSPFKQIVIAASEGSIAALSANEYLNRK